MLAGRIQATDPDDQIAQGGEIVGSMFGADGGAIFAKSDIADVVDGILNAPVASPGNLDLSSAHFGGRTTGQENFHFLGDAHGFEMMSGAPDHGSLGGVRESRVLRRDFEGVDFTSFMPAVALVQSEVRRGGKRPLGSVKAGRAGRRVWVDWL